MIDAFRLQSSLSVLILEKYENQMTIGLESMFHVVDFSTEYIIDFKST